MDPFETYDRVRAERKPLKKTIEGEEFEFPGAPSATIALDFLNLAISNPEADRVDIAVTLLGRLLDDEKKLDKLFQLVSFPELWAITEGLFRHYGLIQKATEASAPNRRARRASKNGSSKGSARSGRTSATATK